LKSGKEEREKQQQQQKVKGHVAPLGFLTHQVVTFETIIFIKYSYITLHTSISYLNAPHWKNHKMRDSSSKVDLTVSEDRMMNRNQVSKKVS